MNKAARIVIVLAVILFMGIAGRRAGAEESLPEGLRGFSGQVRGVVVAKGDENTFTFRVGRVLRVWENNKAETPEALVGRTVPVGPRWTKGDDGEWHPVERHVAFIRTLEAGQELTLEIHNVERSHFAILELSAEQRNLEGRGDAKRDKAADRKTKADESLPEGLRGFSGQVRGLVVAKGDRNTFTFKVGRVLRVLKGNKAENPEALVGRTVPVGPRWVKGEDGKWHPVERHVAFIRTLKPGQEHTLEIKNVERSHFAILELSEEQRKLVQGKRTKRDRPADRKRDTKRDRPAERKKDAEIQELKTELQRLRKEVAELRRLREEVAELRRLLKEKKD